MTQYLLTELNARVKTDPAALIADSEAHYMTQIEQTAAQIAACAKDKPIVLVNGPSSAGKTTTAARLCHALGQKGIGTQIMSMDDYYRSRGSYPVPRDEENQVDDLESPTCMNLALLSVHLQQLAQGEEIMVPRFDFSDRTYRADGHLLRLQRDEVAVIEGIHAFSPTIMKELRSKATGVYLALQSSIVLEDGTEVAPYMLRFMRRAQRDSLFRGSPVEDTIRQWKSVRRGERLYINPYLDAAKMHIDTFLPYEPCILSVMLKERIADKQVQLQEIGLAPVLGLIEQVQTLAPDIPQASLLHEFIG